MSSRVSKSSSQTSHPTARAAGSDGWHSAGLVLFNKWATEVRECPVADKLTQKELENENLEEILTAYATYLALNKIPYAANANKSLSPKTLGKYFSAVKTFFRIKFPNLKCWHTEEMWYIPLTNLVQVRATRDLFTAGGANGEVYDGPKTRPLYANIDKALLRVSERESLQLKGADLTSIVFDMIQAATHDNSGVFTNRAKLVLTYHGMGRGGETKCLRWSEWEWDFLFDCVEGCWTELKMLQRYLMDFVANAYSMDRAYVLDIFHTLGCYFAIEKGLYREKDDSASKLIFPDLYNMTSNQVTSKLSQMLKKHCDKKLAGTTSMKSIRKGCITALSVNPHLVEMDRKLRSGHVHSESSDKSLVYVHSCPALTLPSGKALAGWANPRHNVHSPRLEALSAADQETAYKMMENLFPLISVKHFLPEGKLRPLLRVCFASLLMYYPETCDDLHESHLLPLTIKKSLLATKCLADGMVHSTLIRWAKVIADDFTSRCQAASGVPTFGRADPEAVTLSNTSILSANVDRVASVEKVVTHLNNKVEGLQQDVSELKVLLKQALSVRNQPSQATGVELLSPTAHQHSVSSTSPESTNDEDPISEAPPELQSASREIRFAANTSKSTADTKDPTNSGINVANLLIDVFEAKSLEKERGVYPLLTSVPLPKKVVKKNKANFVRCMGLVMLVWTEDEKKFLRMPRTEYLQLEGGRTKLEKVVREIEKRCLDLQLKRDKKDENKVTAAFVGLGKRIAEWEKANPELAAAAATSLKVQESGGSTLKSFFGRASDTFSAVVSKVTSPKRKRQD